MERYIDNFLSDYKHFKSRRIIIGYRGIKFCVEEYITNNKKDAEKIADYYILQTDFNAGFSPIGLLHLDDFSGLMLAVITKNKELFGKIFNVIVKINDVKQLLRRDRSSLNILFYTIKYPEFRDYATKIIEYMGKMISKPMLLPYIRKEIIDFFVLEHKEYLGSSRLNTSPLVLILVLHCYEINVNFLPSILSNSYFGKEIQEFIIKSNLDTLANMFVLQARNLRSVDPDLELKNIVSISGTERALKKIVNSF